MTIFLRDIWRGGLGISGQLKKKYGIGKRRY